MINIIDSVITGTVSIPFAGSIFARGLIVGGKRNGSR
jgi:hypothetical protein